MLCEIVIVFCEELLDFDQILTGGQLLVGSTRNPIHRISANKFQNAGCSSTRKLRTRHAEMTDRLI